MTPYAQLSIEDIDAIQQVLTFLDMHADFRRDLVKLVDSDDWPDRWLAAADVCDELRQRSFWSNHVRNQVGSRSRPLLVEHYLRTMTEHTTTLQTQGWQRYDDQFKYRRPEIPQDDDDERRRHGRLRCELMKCQYGQIYDISASGVMVVCKRKHGISVADRVELQLQCLDETLTAPSTVARIIKIKRRIHIGMQFNDLTPEARNQLAKMMRVASMCRVI